MQVLVGKIVATYGLKGALKVYSHSDFATTRYKRNSEVILINPETNNTITLKVASYKKVKNMDVVTFLDLNDINLVKDYVGYEIYKEVNSKDLPKDSYFYNDLIGCNLVYLDKIVGKVIAVIDFGRQYNLRVEQADKSTFLSTPAPPPAGTDCPPAHAAPPPPAGWTPSRRAFWIWALPP